MKNWKTYLAAGLLFLSGAIVGIIGTKYFIRHKIERFLEGGPAMMKEAMVRRLTQELQLSPAQQQKALEVVGDAEKRLFELRQRNQPETKRIFDEAFENLGAALSEAQRSRLFEIRQEMRERWERKQKLRRFFTKELNPAETRGEGILQ